jgi:hypothetical protein
VTHSNRTITENTLFVLFQHVLILTLLLSIFALMEASVTSLPFCEVSSPLSLSPFFLPSDSDERKRASILAKCPMALSPWLTFSDTDPVRAERSLEKEHRHGNVVRRPPELLKPTFPYEPANW